MTLDKLSVINGRTTLAGLVWTNLGLLQYKNNSECNQSVCFIKKFGLFLLIKLLKISNQRSLVIGQIGLLIRSTLIYLVDCLKTHSHLTFKNI